MRRALQQKVPKGAGTSAPLFVPAPIGGLNTRDPPALVPITEAVELTKYFPTTTGVARVKEQTTYATGLPNNVETMMVYTTNAGADTMFAAADTAFYNASASGAVGAAVQTGLTNALWHYVNFTLSSGTAYLCAFNGADAPRYWDGTTWTSVTGVSTPAITGVTTTTLVAAAVHKRRIWMVQVNSLKAWYLPADSVGGAAAAIDLGGVADKGGYIAAIDSWTIDGGAGLDDYWVCITSEGQVVVYAGSDPSSASTWAHVGTWAIGQPIARRCLYKYKGDLLMITSAGVASAARIMAGDTTNSGLITDKISGSYLAAYTTYVIGSAQTFGWEIVHYPSENMLLLSLGNGGIFLMNTVTGAWSYSGESARCMAFFNGIPYTVPLGDGVITRKFWDAATGLTGDPSIKLGFSDFGMPGVNKKMNQVRVAMKNASATTAVKLYASADYAHNSTVAAVTIAAVNGISQWFPVGARGVALSLAFSGVSTNTYDINGFHVIYERGGIMGSWSYI